MGTKRVGRVVLGFVSAVLIALFVGACGGSSAFNTGCGIVGGHKASVKLTNISGDTQLVSGVTIGLGTKGDLGIPKPAEVESRGDVTELMIDESRRNRQ